MELQWVMQEHETRTTVPMNHYVPGLSFHRGRASTWSCFVPRDCWDRILFAIVLWNIPPMLTLLRLWKHALPSSIYLLMGKEKTVNDARSWSIEWVFKELTLNRLFGMSAYRLYAPRGEQIWRDILCCVRPVGWHAKQPIQRKLFCRITGLPGKKGLLCHHVESFISQVGFLNSRNGTSDNNV